MVLLSTEFLTVNSIFMLRKVSDISLKGGGGGRGGIVDAMDR